MASCSSGRPEKRAMRCRAAMSDVAVIGSSAYRREVLPPFFEQVEQRPVVDEKTSFAGTYMLYLTAHGRDRLTVIPQTHDKGHRGSAHGCLMLHSATSSFVAINYSRETVA